MIYNVDVLRFVRVITLYTVCSYSTLGHGESIYRGVLLPPVVGGGHSLYVGGYPVPPTRVVFYLLVRRDGSKNYKFSVEKGIISHRNP